MSDSTHLDLPRSDRTSGTRARAMLHAAAPLARIR